MVIFTVGIPILQIGVCIILGVLLIAKGSNIFSSTFKEKQVMSLCVSMAYSILDKKDKTPMFSKFKENGSNILKTELDNLSDNETVNDRQSSENTLFSNQFSSPLINQTPNYNIGDKGPAGGVIFHVIENGLHGMEAAPTDLPSSIWGFYGKSLSGVTAKEVGVGKANTAAIVASSDDAINAGKATGNYFK